MGLSLVLSAAARPNSLSHNFCPTPCMNAATDTASKLEQTTGHSTTIVDFTAAEAERILAAGDDPAAAPSSGADRPRHDGSAAPSHLASPT